ncbi:MAG: hypothetical protein NWE89_05370 [Candidatus Bathyarchaeota archaeon]|nr:hypothetical protein [Candidatus Bathyarchaeota archaeon]
MTPPKVGFEHLPDPIVCHLKKSVKYRLPKTHVYHVTELIYCLRKAYYRRVHPKQATFNTRSLWNIYRGFTFDRQWSPLFKINQKTYTVTRDGISIRGTLDFVYDDGNGDILYDLKMPASTFYKKREGAGQGYRRQVQAYLALGHANRELLDVCRSRVLMVAEEVVVEEVEEWTNMLDSFLWSRAFALDAALNDKDPSGLPGPEEEWECLPEYCSADIDFRIEGARAGVVPALNPLESDS